MKIVYKPLEGLKNKSHNSKTSNNRFDDMLNQHLSKNGNQSHLNSGHQQNTGQNLPRPAETTDSNEGLESLKNIDPAYYEKGVKKKTLASTFSARNNSKLENRIKKYAHLVKAKAKKYGLDPNLLAGLIRQESNFNPYAVSHCGAMGLGQIMPETARYLGVVDPFNAAQNLDAAAKYLKEQLNSFGGNVDKALAAYNAGPGAVKKYGGIPPYKETQNYVRAIRSHRSQISRLDLFSSDKAKKA